MTRGAGVRRRDFLLMAGAALATTACRQGGPGPAAAAGRTLLRLGARDDFRTLDPAIGYDVQSWQGEAALFDGLVDYDSETNVIPRIAEGWEASRDGLSYTFALRPGVRFSHGRQVEAADFQYTIQRVLDPKTNSPGAGFFLKIAGAREFREGRAGWVAGIQPLGGRALRFVLAEPDPLFLHELALPFAYVVPREVAEAYRKDFFRHPVGTGPFVLQEWRSGERLVLARNPDYFRRGLLGVDRVEYQVGLSDQLAILKFESGGLDISGIPSSDFVRITTDPRWKAAVVSEVALTTQYLGLNAQMAPFHDRRVRQAVNSAVDKARIVRLLNGRGTVARGVLPPTMPGYDPSLPGYPYDPERARALLAEAGYPDGFSVDLWLVHGDDPDRIAQAVQYDLRRVGVRVRLKLVSFPALIDAVGRPNTTAFFLLAWAADFPDPSNFLDVLFHSNQIAPVDSNNNTFYVNPAVDALLDRARRTLDPEGRMALYREAERQVVADAPWVFLYHPIGYAIHQPWVRGHAIHPLRALRLEEIAIAR